jgi:hypothetical protein
MKMRACHDSRAVLFIIDVALTKQIGVLDAQDVSLE